MFKFKLLIKSLFLSTLAVSAISNGLAKNSDYDPILKADFSKIPQYKLATAPRGENETKEEYDKREHAFYTSERATKAFINLFKNKKAKEIIYNALNKKSLTDEEIVELINNEVGGEFVFLKEPDTFKLTKKFDVTLKTKKQMPYKLSNLYGILKERGIETNLISATLPFFYYQVK
ncbi:hypothetical protein [Avibacterium paragallinarum]|uniref:hypothetical protein n=1 Tax=Avibacterium paragallinarum TaxID=728 RepID=UPI002ED83DBD